MESIIRSMQIDDYEAALSLWRRTPGMGLSAADEKPELEKFLKRNATLCFVAMAGQKLTGTILCGEDGRRGYIYHLAVDSNYQRTGIGKALVQHALAELQRIGIQKCHLFVYGSNTSGIAFWKHNGWVMRDDIELMSIDLI
ncbi:MAG: GNAT family N-acetyltransferase [Chloroflexi bacterium]|mgnify:CR=1 FL=1|nr:GNAT family N-acetyltransferase [Chloroflexota bacterium]